MFLSNNQALTETSTYGPPLSLHDTLPIYILGKAVNPPSTISYMNLGVGQHCVAIEVVVCVTVASIAKALVPVIDTKYVVNWLKNCRGSYVLRHNSVLWKLFLSLEPVVYLLDNEILDAEIFRS